MITIAFSGHRPDKLDGYEWYTIPKEIIKANIQLEVVKILMQHPNETYKFIFGGAIGIDQMAFDIIYRIKTMKLFPQLDCENWILEIAVPFQTQEKFWRIEDRKRYYEQLQQADIITMVDTLEKYNVWNIPIGVFDEDKLHKRNEYMVDNADYLIAVWNGSKGGTASCVRYARFKKKEIIQINPKNYLTKSEK